MNNKIVFLGDATVGKTSLIHRFIKKTFQVYTESTIGAAFNYYPLTTSNGTVVKLDIWDTAGQERYNSLVPLYYRDAKCAVIVFDLTNKDSYYHALKWIDKVKSEFIYLVGNKYDTFNGEAVHTLSNKQLYNNVIYIETSAKTGYNIEELFMDIAENILHNTVGYTKTYKEDINELTQTTKTCNCIT